MRIFNYLTGYAEPRSFEKLVIAPLALRTTLLQLIRDLLEVSHRPAEPVKLRHHERVTLAQIPKGLRQRRPLRQGARCVFDEDLVAPRSFERIRLAVRILVPGRDAGVTDRGHASA